MRSGRHVFLLALAFLVLWWQPGVYMNDEVSQSVALTNLAEGDLVVDDSPGPGYEPFTSGFFRHTALPQEGGFAQFTASVPMMVAALPLLFVLRFLEAGLGVMGALGLAAGVVVGSAVAVELRWRGRIDWSQAGSVAGLSVFILAWPRSARFAASPLLEMAAQQLVSMAAVAGAGLLLWDLTRRIWGRSAAPVALFVFLVATPAFFWAGNLKYHSISLLFLAWAAHALWRGWQGRAFAWAEAGLATGIGFWNHAPTGLTMMAGFGIVGLTELLRQRSWRPLLGLPAFAVGILPDLALRWWYRRHLVRPRYFAGSTTGESVAEGLRESAVEQVEHTSYLDAPLQYAATMWELLVWTPYLKLGAAMGVLAMAPWLALAVRRWRLHPLVVFAVVVGATTIVGSGRRLTEIGAGFDQRYVSALWPLLVMAAVPGILACWRPHHDHQLKRVAWWSLGVAAWVALLQAVWAFANGGSILYLGFAHDVTFMHRFAGLGVFAVAAVLWLFRSHLNERMRAMIALLPVVSAASLWLLIGMAGEMHGQRLSAPFVVWPMDLLVRFVRGMYGLY